MSEFANVIGWAEANVETFVFYLLAVLAIPLAYGVIFDRVVIRSGFLLIGVFGAVSGLFLLLEAQFLAMAQIMIYGVGITLIVVIALMLTNPRLEQELSPALSVHKVSAATAAILLFVTIHMALRSEQWPVVTSGAPQVDPVRMIGASLMMNYALPFEFASVLLLAALVGAIMLAKAEPLDAKSNSDMGNGVSGGQEERIEDVVKV